jgi:hypothetical protein
LTDTERETRDLTKAEIGQAFREGMVAGPDALTMLGAMGYDEREAGTLLALWESQAQKAQQTALRDAVKARYQRGTLDLAGASTALDGLGVEASYRDALLAKWEAEKIAKGEKVPPSTVRDLWLGDIIPADRATSLLEGQGWPPDVIQGIMALWKRGKGSAA